MKNHLITVLALGIFTAGFLILSSFKEVRQRTPLTFSDNVLRQEAFKILESKCNACHRKKNPFILFNQKNMSKRAPRIYRMVFLERRMPKGNEVKLTQEEYNKLEQWLFTQEIF